MDQFKLMVPDILFQSKNLALRRFNLDDAEFVLTLLNTATWVKYIGQRNIHTQQDALTYLHNGPLASYQKNGYGPWLVMLKNTQQPIGMCGLFKRDYLGSPDLGFAFMPEFEGLGYAYESCVAALNYIKANYDLDNLYATTTDENIRSKRLLTRCGFTQTGQVTPPDGGGTLLLYQISL